MSMSLRRRTTALVAMVAGAITISASLSGCADDGTPSPRAATPATYTSTSFTVPFDVTLPGWLPPKPSVESGSLVTWEATDGIRKVRVMRPAAVYRPAESAASAVPVDFRSYLLDLADVGATITHEKTTTIDGQPALLATMSTADPLDGVLGCPDPSMAADDCFGLQPELTLRVAEIEVRGTPVLAWLRTDSDDAGKAAAMASFETMLRSIRFPDRPAASSSPSAGSSALDGTWTVSYTRAALAASPLLMDKGEINDDNWGTETLVFAGGDLTATMSNPVQSGTQHETFSVNGDKLVIESDTERFAVRWKISGDQLVLTRDDALGVSPTPLVIRPFARASG